MGCIGWSWGIVSDMGLDVNTLRNLYESQLLSDYEIADTVGVHPSTVSRARKRHGIQSISEGERNARRAGNKEGARVRAFNAGPSR